MLLGLVTDSHSHHEPLARCLELLRRRGVDRVVTAGDTIEGFARADWAGPAAELLLAADAVGVWGNHDVNLCLNVSDYARSLYPASAFALMGRMRPRLEIDGYAIAHREASVDPLDPAALWDFGEGPIDLPARARSGFGASAARVQLVGHYHRWFAATPEAPLPWDGTEALAFDPGRRYFVALAAACDGYCAVLDTRAGTLEPLRA
jgi:predicted phosphodiesterase